MRTADEDFILQWEGLHYRPNSAKCRVRIWRRQVGSPVVLVTELPDNCGCSVTNGCALIVDAAC